METGASLTPDASREVECAIAAAAVRWSLPSSSGMKLAYSSDLPDEKGVSEGAWTGQMSVPFLREFDARHQVSAIPLCTALRSDLEALGGRVAQGRDFEGQWGLPKRERTAVILVTLPVVSADGSRALVRVESRCGFGCVNSLTYQFVRDGNDWKQNALRMEWSGTVMFDQAGRQIGPGR